MGSLPNPRRHVPLADNKRCQDVVLRPIALVDDPPQLVRIDLELRWAMPWRRVVIGDRWRSTSKWPDQLNFDLWHELECCFDFHE